MYSSSLRLLALGLLDLRVNVCVLHVGGEERGGGGGGKVSGSVGGVERLDGVEMEGGSSVWGGGGTSAEEGEGEET